MPGSWLQWLIFNPERSDVQVQCELPSGGVAQFPVHSPILSAQSEYFRLMLHPDENDPLRMGTFKITSFSSRTVDYCLRFFYTNTIPRRIYFDDILSILQFAHVSQTKSLLDLCCSRLSLEVSLDQVCEVYEIAKVSNLTLLAEKCISMIMRSWQTIITYDLHFSLSLQSLQSFVVIPSEESDVADANLRAIKRWFNWSSFAHGVTMEDLNQEWSSWSLRDVVLTSQYMTSQQDIPWPAELCCQSFLSDTDIRIEGNEIACFPAHSLVLNKHSEVFLRTWLETRPTEEGKYHHRLPKCDVRVVEYFLRFLYTRFFPNEISMKNLLGLLDLAHKYQVKELMAKCEEKVIRKMTIQSCCHVYAHTKNMACSSVHEVCIRFLAQRLDLVLSNYLHFVLDKTQLISVLSASNQNITSTNEYMQAWGKWQCIILGLSLHDVECTNQVEAVLVAVNLSRSR